MIGPYRLNCKRLDCVNFSATYAIGRSSEVDISSLEESTTVWQHFERSFSWNVNWNLLLRTGVEVQENQEYIDHDPLQLYLYLYRLILGY